LRPWPFDRRSDGGGDGGDGSDGSDGSDGDGGSDDGGGGGVGGVGGVSGCGGDRFGSASPSLVSLQRVRALAAQPFPRNTSRKY
jgi:hypothetical protein